MQLIAGLLMVLCVLLGYIAYLLYRIATHDSGGTTDDPDGSIKQEIMDKLDRAIKDIKSTV